MRQTTFFSYFLLLPLFVAGTTCPSLLHKQKKLQDASEIFFDELKKEKSVRTLVPDKLYYRILTSGKGPRLNKEELGLFHIKCQNLFGKIFIDTRSTSKTKKVDLSTCDEGLALGVLEMQQGEKRLLYVHPQLAPSLVEAAKDRSVLLYEVELIKHPSKKKPTLSRSTQETHARS